MTRKRTHRRVWATNINPVAHAIAGAAITDPARLDRLRMLELSAIEAFRAGRATVEDWKAMADMNNVAETLARSGIGPEVLEACAAAERALDAAHDRFKRHGTIGRAAGEYEALRSLYEFHDLQRQSISRSEYEKAIQKTANRIKTGAHVRVCIV